jgi:ribonuclease Z
LAFQVTILGTGSATPTLWRNPSAQVLHADGEYYLIDCGEGTQTQMLKYKIRPGRLQGIFITHLHGDHYFGLIGLLTSLSLGRRTAPLRIWGPPGLADIITLQLKYSGSILSFMVDFQAVDPNTSYQLFENDYFTVHTIPLTHRVHCSGYLFREKNHPRKLIKELLPPDLSTEHLKRLKEGYDVLDSSGQVSFAASQLTKPAAKPLSFAYCSDTIFDERIVPQLKNVNLLYHEATFLHTMLDWANKTYHTTALQAAQIAQMAGVGQLIIGHFSSRYKDATPLLDEARSVFLNTLLATEGETYAVTEHETATPPPLLP